jgi:2'-5' RNA ligase
MALSGLIVEAAAGEAVDAWRRRLDPQALLGVPAHVTVLFPFVPPDQFDADTESELTRLFAATPTFDFRLVDTAWFGDDILWLAPEPSEPFRQLTRTLADSFPDHPPYGGRFVDPVPHLTIGTLGPSAELRRAEQALRADLPIHVTTGVVTHMTESPDGRWRRARSYQLGS